MNGRHNFGYSTQPRIDFKIVATCDLLGSRCNLHRHLVEASGLCVRFGLAR